MTMADAVKTVEQLCAENGIDARQLAERSGLDEQRVVAIVLGLATAGSWVGRSTDHSAPDSRSGTTTRQLQRKEQPADGPRIDPTPLMRPLALIANAIGPDPLFVLDQPGKPSLAAGYADAVTPTLPGTCARMRSKDADRDDAWDSTFR